MIKCTVKNKQTCCVIKLDYVQINCYSNIINFNNSLLLFFFDKIRLKKLLICQFFQQNLIQIFIHFSVFRQNPIQQCIQNFEIGSIQFYKIFIQ